MSEAFIIEDIRCIAAFLVKAAEEKRVQAAKNAIEKIEERLNDLSRVSVK